MNLRQLAKGQPCQLRLPTICNDNPETTVLAHIRNATFGMGIKPPDIIGVWACHACHDELDRRTNKLKRDEVYVAALSALCRQLKLYVDKGIVKW